MDHEVTLTPKGERWSKSRHPWVYQDDVKERDPSFSGDIVRVKAPNGRFLGQAFYNAKSKIALRWLESDPDRLIDRDFWSDRLAKAIEHRAKVVRDSSAYRLVFSEADGFPGLIVDRYDTTLVVQALSLGIDRILPLLTELLIERLNPKTIVARNDASVRALEGLPVEKRMILGERASWVEVTEGKCRYLVDVWEGHKTGTYLDQRENRLWAGGFAKGRVLDAFSYQGAFTLQAAQAAAEVLAIEDSQWALGLLEENLKLNRLTHVRVERGNVFDRLKTLEKEGQRFDLAILDPPAFARNKNELSGAYRGYREINLRAMRILNPGGVLVSCSCSYQVSEEIFLAILQEAAADAERSLRLIDIRTQAKDHPILISHPESKYLKCVALEVIK